MTIMIMMVTAAMKTMVQAVVAVVTGSFKHHMSISYSRGLLLAWSMPTTEGPAMSMLDMTARGFRKPWPSSGMSQMARKHEVTMHTSITARWAPLFLLLADRMLQGRRVCPGRPATIPPIGSGTTTGPVPVFPVCLCLFLASRGLLELRSALWAFSGTGKS